MNRPRGKPFKLRGIRLARTLAIATLCCVVGANSTARAALLDVQIPDVLIQTDGLSPLAESLFVDLVGTGAEQMGGYTFSIDVVPQGGATGSVALTGANDVVGQLIDSSNFAFASTGTFDIVSDATDSGTVSAVTGDLFELDFLVAAGTDGVFDVKFLFSPTFPGSEVQDGLGLPISTDFMDGSITVTAPDPSTVVIFVGAAMMLLRQRTDRPIDQRP